MVDVFQAVLTAFAAVTVFVIGQIIVKFFIEPVDDFKKHIGDIADTLIYYSNVIVNPPPKVREYPPVEPIGYIDAAPLRSNEYPLPGAEEFIKSDAEIRTKVRGILRQKASLLISKTHMVNGYWLFEKLRVVPKRSSIENAHGKLIYLHNCLFKMHPLENAKISDEIFELLNIKYK